MNNDAHFVLCVVHLCVSVSKSIISLVCYSDASFGNLVSGHSQGAYVVFIVDKYGRANVLSWQSRKIKRVCNSTISAECLAAVEAVNASIYLKTLVKEMIGAKCTNLKVRLVVDNKALLDAISSKSSVEDKRLRIDISLLRECISNKDINGIYWVASHDNLANALTKQGASHSKLIEALNGQCKFDFSKNIFV